MQTPSLNTSHQGILPDKTEPSVGFRLDPESLLEMFPVSDTTSPEDGCVGQLLIQFHMDVLSYMTISEIIMLRHHDVSVGPSLQLTNHIVAMLCNLSGEEKY